MITLDITTEIGHCTFILRKYVYYLDIYKHWSVILINKTKNEMNIRKDPKIERK